MNQPKYVPGQAYRNGYDARMEGREMPAINEIGVYWDEFRAGWFDANRTILENVRRDYENSRNRLTENSNQREFLQD
jgi:hypothetical protein